MKTFKIVWHYFKGRKYTLKRGLSLAQAQEHCADPETSSETAKSPYTRRLTRKHGPWFDSYTES